jgi:hypothetical protein
VRSLWRAGIFLLVLFVICVLVFSGSAYILGGVTFSLIAVGTLLVVAIVSAVVLRASGLLSERNTLVLAENALKRLTLLHRAVPAETAAEPGSPRLSRRARKNSPR